MELYSSKGVQSVIQDWCKTHDKLTLFQSNIIPIPTYQPQVTDPLTIMEIVQLS